jgi:hypothetical protein
MGCCRLRPRLVECSLPRRDRHRPPNSRSALQCPARPGPKQSWPATKPGRLRVLKPAHPLARGLPGEFGLPHTEMYDEPFHAPEPDEVVIEDRWAGGEWFRSGMAWRVGKGLQVAENAVRWLGGAGE